MTRAPHEVILASAGTGKTFRLARRYVRLLATGEDHGSILATTFTRKAAREILARVLQWLARGAAGGKDFEQLTADVWGDDAPPADWSAERCQKLLGEVVRGLHRFQVRTLDAWFASLARLFGLELGLPPGWTIADDRDDARLRDAVLTRLFEEEGDAVPAMLEGLQGGDFTRRVHSAQQELLGAGLELLRDSDAYAWEAVGPDPEADADPAALRDALSEFEIPVTKTGKQRTHWVNALGRLRDALAREDAWEALGAGPVRKLLDGETTFDRVEIEGSMERLLRDVIVWAARVVLADLRGTNQAVRLLLKKFETRYAEAKRAEGGYRHDDVPRTLVDAAGRLDPVSVAFRSGARIRHLMLDEFQDTSVWQWRVLEPLLARIAKDGDAATGGATGDDDSGPPSLFCVGDVKQAIYTWRQGEPELLAGLSDWYELGEPEQLAKSWRSSQAVLDLVNAVFGQLGERADEIPGMDAEAARKWAAAWLPHEAAKQALGGVARARIVAKGEDDRAPMLEQCADEVARLHHKHPEGTIGVLLRRRRQMAALLHLLEERGIHASGEGGSELTDAQAVQALLSAFRLADRPSDTLAAYHLASGPLAESVGLRAELAGERGSAFSDAAAACSARLRDRLQELGIGGFVESFRTAVLGGWPGDRWEKRRYAQLVDLAHGFDAGPARRPGDFVEHVEGTPLENPAPSRVRVMTIHGSKGLEFDSVVFPLWHSEAGGRDLFIYRRDDPRDRCTAVSKRPSSAVAPLSVELQKLFDETATRNQTEALCVLYVALTRAKKRLEVLVEEGPKTSRSFSLARLVERMLGLEDGESWPRTVPDDEPASEQVPKPEDASTTDGAAEDVALDLKAAAGTRGRPRWAPSGAEAEQMVDGGKLFLRGGDAARTRGTAIHRLFQEVEWLDQPTAFDAPDSELCALLVQEGVGDGSTHVDALRSFRKSLMRTEVKQLLMRVAYQEQGGHEPWVWRERKFAMRLPEPGGGTDAILHGEFDRVVIERDADGAPLRAHVVDFKTGRVRDEEELARKTEAYRPQMLAYRQAVCAMTGLAPEAVRLSLLFVDAGRVAHLDEA